MSGLEEKAYILAYDQLRSQKADLQAYRGQASFCAAISGIIASVFVGLIRSTGGSLSAVADANGLALEVWAALIAFSLSVFASVATVAGWRVCRFDLNPQRFLHAAKEDEAEEDLFRHLAEKSDSYFDANEKILDQTKNVLSFGLVMAFLQIPIWTTVIVKGLDNG